jgi:mannose-6-phosphate isomerase
VTPLTNPIRTYAWGSHTVLAALQRRAVPSAEPEAELWIGAHPTAPSHLAHPGGPVALNEAIAADPEATLGRAVADRFGPRLPYLLKVLAATQPLSLQAHPDAERARAGFAAEAGLAADDPRRNYRDPYHKPELLVAIEPFEALCGFRDPDASAALMASFGVPELTALVEALSAGSAPERLRRAVELLMAWPAARRADLIAAVTKAGGSAAPGSAVHGLAARLGGLYPDDVGVLVALLLNHLRLRPGEGVFMPPGTLHAYLSGVGVEVMAASDNVLRGGLTPKHVDVAELLRSLRYEVTPDPVVRSSEMGPGVTGWTVPAEEFALTRVEVPPGADPVVVDGRGPRVVAGLSGVARLRCAGQEQRVGGGDAVFVPAGEPAVEVAADGGDGAVVFQTAVGIRTQ